MRISQLYRLVDLLGGDTRLGSIDPDALMRCDNCFRKYIYNGN